MPVPDVLYANDLDLSTLDVDVLSADGFWAAFSTGRARISPSGSIGTIASDTYAVPARSWPLQLALVCDPDDRDTKLAALRKHLRGLVEWRFGDSDLVLYGIVEESGGGGRFGPLYVMQEGDLTLSLSVICDDPVKYDRYSRTLALNATPVSVTGGDLPSAGEVWVYGGSGGAATPALNLRSPAGNIVITKTGATVTMQFATLGTDEALQVILGSEQRIVFWDNGVASNGLSKLTGGWFCAPEDGDTLELTAGYGEYVYRRAFR